MYDLTLDLVAVHSIHFKRLINVNMCIKSQLPKSF